MKHLLETNNDILETFYEDIRSFVLEQVTPINLNQKSIKFIHTAQIGDLLSKFIYFRKRYPVGKYKVYISENMCSSSKYCKYKKQIWHIKKLLEEGRDIKDFLHNDINDFLFHDNLLQDWGIIHIHLWPRGSRKNKDNDILYAIQIEDSILFLKIDTHKYFLQKELLEILYQNVPNFLCFFPIPGDDFTEKEIENRMKDPQDSLKLVIVCDMWLTGFDVPSLHTMYIDKPIRAHNLIQAISRVNRVFKDKPSGLVVDYIGMARALEEAVRDYTRGGGQGDVAINVRRAYEELLSYMDICRSYLKGFDYSQFKTKPYDLVASAWNYILENAKDKESVQKEFADKVLAALKAYGLCQSLPEASVLSEELAFFSLLKTAISKKESDKNKQSLEEIKTIIGNIVSKAIATDKPIDIFEQAGLEKPNLSLADERFLEKIHAMKHKDLAAELLRRLIEGEIKSKFRLNVSLQKRFSEKLKETVNKYNNGSIETVQVIEELINIAKETNEAIRQGEKLGLSEKELAFYNALEENESAVRDLGDEILKKIAQELTNYLRNSVKIDWSKRESVKAGIRIQIKRILNKYSYPPDKQQAATERVLEQAELVTDELMK